MLANALESKNLGDNVASKADLLQILMLTGKAPSSFTSGINMSVDTSIPETADKRAKRIMLAMILQDYSLGENIGNETNLNLVNTLISRGLLPEDLTQSVISKIDTIPIESLASRVERIFLSSKIAAFDTDLQVLEGQTLTSVRKTFVSLLFRAEVRGDYLTPQIKDSVNFVPQSAQDRVNGILMVLAHSNGLNIDILSSNLRSTAADLVSNLLLDGVILMRISPVIIEMIDTTITETAVERADHIEIALNINGILSSNLTTPLGNPVSPAKELVTILMRMASPHQREQLTQPNALNINVNTNSPVSAEQRATQILTQLPV